MRTISRLFLATVLVVRCAKSDVVPFESEAERRAFVLLGNAPGLHTRRIGAVGDPSEYVEAYRTLLESPAAAEHFARVLEEASTEAGRLYALGGLYFTDRSLYAEHLDAFLTQEDTIVPTLSWCVGDREPVSQVAAQIDDGFWPRDWAEGIVEDQ